MVVNSRYVFKNLVPDHHDWPNDVVAGHYIGGYSLVAVCAAMHKQARDAAKPTVDGVRAQVKKDARVNA